VRLFYDTVSFSLGALCCLLERFLCVPSCLPHNLFGSFRRFIKLAPGPLRILNTLLNNCLAPVQCLKNCRECPSPKYKEDDAKTAAIPIPIPGPIAARPIATATARLSNGVAAAKTMGNTDARELKSMTKILLKDNPLLCCSMKFMQSQ